MWRFMCCVYLGPQRFPLIRALALGLLIVISIPRGVLMAQPHAADAVSALALRGLGAPMAVAGVSGTNFEADEVIQVTPQKVKAGTAGRVLINLQFPEGYHLNPRAPLYYSVSVSGEGMTIAASDRMGQPIAPLLPLAIPFQAAAGIHQATADIDMTFYYCREDDTGVCVIQSVRWQVPLHMDPDGSSSEVVVAYRAEVPAVQKQL